MIADTVGDFRNHTNIVNIDECRLTGLAIISISICHQAVLQSDISTDALAVLISIDDVACIAVNTDYLTILSSIVSAFTVI